MESTENALRESEELYRSLMETYPDAVTMTGLDGRIIMVNRQALRINRCDDAAQLIGKDAFDLIAPADRERARQNAGLVLDEHPIHGIEYAMLRSDGSVFPGVLSASLIRDADGRPKAFIGITRDITKQKKTEQDLVLAKDIAEKANHAKSEFLSIMSHELRTPLTSILGFSELLLMKKQKSGEENEIKFLEKILKNGHHLLNLINGILDLAKIESGKAETALQTFNLRNMLEEIIALLTPLVRKKPVKLYLEMPPVSPRILSDELKLKQVIINLVDNAIKFTEKGSVAIIVHIPEATGEIPLKIEVRDTGTGIPENKFGVIFDHFQQGEDVYTRQYRGSGLGLSIARSIVNLLGGRITVQSRINVGSSFIVSLPGSIIRSLEPVRPLDLPLKQSPVPAAKPIVAPEVAGKKIFVIDDDKDSNDLICEWLSMMSVTPFPSGDMRPILEAMKHGRPDLFLLDIRLAGVSGADLLKEIRKNNTLNGIPVIALTAYALKGDREKYLRMGFDEYVSKPIHFTDLITAIKKVIGSP